jgi:hypothetical protein
VCGGIEENDGVNFSMIIWYIVRTFVNATRYFQHNHKKMLSKKKKKKRKRKKWCEQRWAIGW